jgi:hypothetical protein
VVGSPLDDADLACRTQFRNLADRPLGIPIGTARVIMEETAGEE